MVLVFQKIVSIGHLIATLILAIMAIFALFGFAHPFLDLFNHAQIVLFWSLLLTLLATPFMHSQGFMKSLCMTIAAVGLASSSLIYVPELVRGVRPFEIAIAEDASRYVGMTFNVFGRNETPIEIVNTIKTVNPDFVALQEYNPYVRKAIHEQMSIEFPYFQYCNGGSRAFVGLYSKIKFQSIDAEICTSSVESHERTARIVALMQPENGAEFIIATTHNDWPAPITRQVEQFSSLNEGLKHIETPMILMGDFNSTPWSYALRDFQKNGNFTRYTQNLASFPTQWYYFGGWRPTPALLPIDHVMTRGKIGVSNIQTGDASGSDHLPLIIELAVPK